MEDEKPGSAAEAVLAAEEENVDKKEVETESVEDSKNKQSEPGDTTSTTSQEDEAKVPTVVVEEVVKSRQVEEVDKPAAATVVKTKDKDKINILLKAVGDAPILKQKLWAVPADREVYQIIEFVKKYLKLDKHQSLFLFVNQAFAPSPDQPLKELYECFGSDGKIVLHYSTTYAWG